MEDLPPPAGFCCSQKYSQSLVMVTRTPAVTRCSLGQEDTPPHPSSEGLRIISRKWLKGMVAHMPFLCPACFLVIRAHCWGARGGGHLPL